MPIKRVGKFLETSDLGITRSVGIETTQIARCVSHIQKKKILGAFGCPAFGFRQDNLDFLNELALLKQVWFWEIDLKDISGLYALDNLEYFGVHEKRDSIDFSQFPRLRKAVWHPVKNDRGLDELDALLELDIWRYKPKDKSYETLEIPASIEKLDLNWCNPSSLDQMPMLENLLELQIHYCRNLTTINSLLDFAPNLRRLVITRCANLT
ncbi:MAG: hypothetical protein AAF387_15795, partial [Pseudomonadota bacterium]